MIGRNPSEKERILIRLGLDANQTYAFSRSRKRHWAIAQSPVIKVNFSRWHYYYDYYYTTTGSLFCVVFMNSIPCLFVHILMFQTKLF